MKRTAVAVAAAALVCLAGCSSGTDGGAAASSSAGPLSQTSSSATSDTDTQAPDSAPTPTPTTSAGPTAGQQPGGSAVTDPVAAENCHNAQEAYRPVVAALSRSPAAAQSAAAQAPDSPLDTNTTTPAGRTATQAILDLQQANLMLAAQGSAASVANFQAKLVAVRAACSAVGAPVFG